MSNRHEIRVPDLGDFAEVEVVEVMVVEGDHVSTHYSTWPGTSPTDKEANADVHLFANG